jgi:hypothetical protein
MAYTSSSCGLGEAMSSPKEHRTQPETSDIVSELARKAVARISLLNRFVRMGTNRQYFERSQTTRSQQVASIEMARYRKSVGYAGREH